MDYHYYQLEVVLANPEVKIDFNQKAGILQEAINLYNAKPMQNTKRLQPPVIDPTGCSFNVVLFSKKPLQFVGKAMRTFTNILLTEIADKDFINAVAKSGALFQYSTPLDEKEKEEALSSTNIRHDQLSDCELIKALIDYVCGHRDTNSTIYRRKRNAIEEMKKIAIEAEIIRFTGGLK